MNRHWSTFSVTSPPEQMGMRKRIDHFRSLPQGVVADLAIIAEISSAQAVSVASKGGRGTYIARTYRRRGRIDKPAKAAASPLATRCHHLVSCCGRNQADTAPVASLWSI